MASMMMRYRLFLRTKGERWLCSGPSLDKEKSFEEAKSCSEQGVVCGKLLLSGTERNRCTAERYVSVSATDYAYINAT